MLATQGPYCFKPTTHQKCGAHRGVSATTSWASRYAAKPRIVVAFSVMVALRQSREAVVLQSPGPSPAEPAVMSATSAGSIAPNGARYIGSCCSSRAFDAVTWLVTKSGRLQPDTIADAAPIASNSRVLAGLVFGVIAPSFAGATSPA